MKRTGEVGIGTPTLEQSFPALFSRSQPAIEKESPLVFAASLLRFHSVEAAMILVDETRPMKIGPRVAFVGGYSVLATLQRTKPELSYKELFAPSERSAIAVPPIAASRGLSELLAVFQGSRFGFTAITKGEMFAMVGLSDVLPLYEEGVLGTDLLVRDVASQPVAVGGHTSVREAMRLMFERRIRRVFVKGAKAFVSDREIVSSIFSPKKLREVRRSPESLLEGDLLDMGPVESVEVEGDMPLKEAAPLLVRSQGGALTCEAGIVSPWDVVMKPFVAGRLSMERPATGARARS